MNDENKKLLTVHTETIGERIRNLREAKGFSQSSLASVLGTVQTVLSMWERGAKEVPDIYIEKLAITFEVSRDFLLIGKKKSSSEVKTYFDPSKIKSKEERENKAVEKTSPFSSLQEKPTLLREKNILHDDGTFKGFRGPTPEMPKVEPVSVHITAVVHEADIINTQTDEWAKNMREYGKAAEPVVTDIPVGHKEENVDASVIIRSEYLDAECVGNELIINGFKWIARDESGGLWVFENKPTKDGSFGRVWDDDSQGDSMEINESCEMFSSVKWTDAEPTEITEDGELVHMSTLHNSPTAEPDLKVILHRQITEELNSLYEAKNHDYGDSFGETYRKLGIISAVTRISDKVNRLQSLCTKTQRVADESILDTLRDCANYCIMTIIELEEAE